MKFRRIPYVRAFDDGWDTTTSRMRIDFWLVVCKASPVKTKHCHLQIYFGYKIGKANSREFEHASDLLKNRAGAGWAGSIGWLMETACLLRSYSFILLACLCPLHNPLLRAEVFALSLFSLVESARGKL